MGADIDLTAGAGCAGRVQAASGPVLVDTGGAANVSMVFSITLQHGYHRIT